MTLRYRILPTDRCGQLKTMLEGSQKGIRIIEAHNGLSAIVASTTSCETTDGTKTEFDGLWISSLTTSASQGIPDSELSSIERRLDAIQEIANVTNKPIIVDGDTGGEAVHLEYFCSRLEALGISAVIVEDKKHPKRNSLSEGATHHLEDPEVFAQKIRRARNVLLSDDFMIFARLESLIANQGVEDALSRARTYLLSGADGIMIHSKQRTTDEVYEFLTRYELLCVELGFRKPVICVPTTYNRATAQELFERGANIAIYANHLLRAAHHAMQQVSETILKSGRSLEAEDLCTPVPQLFEVVGFNDIVARDVQTDRSSYYQSLEGVGGVPLPEMPQLSGKLAGAKKLRILVLGRIDDEAVFRLSLRHSVVVLKDKSLSYPPEILAVTDVIVVRSPHKITRQLIESCPQLRWIIRAGSGTDNIDMSAVKERKITVYTTPLSAPAVAELAFGLMLAVSRQIPELHGSMQQGEWRKYASMGHEISGKTVAIVGFGRIGRQIAKMARGFEMRILAIDPTPEKAEKQTVAKDLEVTFLSLMEALPETNILVLCCPLNAETQDSIGLQELQLLPRGSIVINVARGGVVNADALHTVLESGHLFGAGIDTYASEPPGSSALVRHPHVVATPHVGAQTAETFSRIGHEVERILKTEILPEFKQGIQHFSELGVLEATV